MGRRLVLIVALAWAGSALLAQSQAPYAWQVPASFPVPPVPADNPMSDAKVELGRYLFYDTRLSGNGKQSCGSCHEQARAFTDGKGQSVGSTGELHPRGSMSLVNIAYASSLTWANPQQTRLEEQALVPMYGEHPIELGLKKADAWVGELKHDARYQKMFGAAYPGTADPISRDNAVKAIATFERAIVSARSPYDRYHFDREDTAISAAAKRGETLFHSRPLSCFTCHGGPNFTSNQLENTGLYNLPGELSFPANNTGAFEITHDPKDVGKFKPPTLRNVAVTAPYMHDGSIATLEAVIDHYAAGGRTITDGPYKGVGSGNPNKAAAIHGFTVTPEQRADLVEFLKSLTDDALLHDPRFSNPYPR